MKQAKFFHLQPNIKLLLEGLGIDSSGALRQARLPEDLFDQSEIKLDTGAYFRLWHGLEASSSGRELPLELGSALTPEFFSPPLFASLCSPNMNVALSRLSAYKRLIGPMHLQLDIGSITKVRLNLYHSSQPLPRCLGTTEVVFLTHLIRLATRSNITPRYVRLKHLPDNMARYSDYFGTSPVVAEHFEIAFDARDATRPFLTENTEMWKCFEPSLNVRLKDLDKHASTTERVKSVLLELLPSGESRVEQVAKRLAMSARTLQRRLSQEEYSYQTVLNMTREELAQHYLSNSSLSQAEISFLLGFQDSNSFIRAYHQWTGSSPGQYRRTL